MLLNLMKKDLMTNRLKTLVNMKYYGAGWGTQHNTSPEKNKNTQQTNLGAETTN